MELHHRDGLIFTAAPHPAPPLRPFAPRIHPQFSVRLTDPGKCPVKRVQWRALPAHRKGKRPPIIMQNVDTATYFGVDKFGAAQCVEEAAEEQNDAIHLQLEADPETGLAFLVNPHWHFERGAPFVLRGVGKTETDRTVSEVRCAHHARVCTCMIVA